MYAGGYVGVTAVPPGPGGQQTVYLTAGYVRGLGMGRDQGKWQWCFQVKGLDGM